MQAGPKILGPRAKLENGALTFLDPKSLETHLKIRVIASSLISATWPLGVAKAPRGHDARDIKRWLKTAKYG